MHQRELVELGDIDPAAWRILIRGTVYGPYTLGQVRSFAQEGRIGAHSKLARGEQASFLHAETYAELGDIFAAEDEATAQPENALNNYLIIVQPASLPEGSPLLDTLNAAGRFTEAMPGIFVLRSSERVGTLRRQLNEVSHPGEQIVIVDASNDRLAWCNLSVDASEHLRAVWGNDG
ncbi:MAG: hypothetical protein AAFX02_10260 [Pseudomonadota bacterium]